VRTTLIVPTADGLLRATPEGRVQSHALRGVFVRDVIVHPEEPRVLYAASPAAGVWRSADGGRSWRCVLAQASCSLAMDADDVDAILAGTSTGAVLATADGGAHWEAVLDPSPDRGAIVRLQNQPAAPEVLYADTAAGEVLRSANRGRTWAPCAAALEPVRLSALHPRRVDALLCANATAVFQSADGGRSWAHRFDCPAPIEAMVVLPGAPDLVVVGAPDGEGSAEALVTGPAGERVNQAADACALAVDLDEPGSVYGVTRRGDLLRSLDAGEHWRRLETRWPAPAGVLPFSHRPEG
jgi:photosystem II stability/assembly factor-like uncharacterized protein